MNLFTGVLMLQEPKNSASRENRELVRRFFTTYPFADQTDCARHTGLSRITVNRHFQALKAEQEARRQKANA
jgi:DNA invertase Pin-like site-specific DNA recombinase